MQKILELTLFNILIDYICARCVCVCVCFQEVDGDIILQSIQNLKLNYLIPLGVCPGVFPNWFLNNYLSMFHNKGPNRSI